MGARMKRIMFVLGTLAALITPVMAQGFITKLPIACGQRSDVLRELENKYGEVVCWSGISTSEQGQSVLAELWYAKNSWTLTLTRTENPEILCILTAGTGTSIFKIPQNPDPANPIIIDR
jgi:hypothetical protein